MKLSKNKNKKEKIKYIKNIRITLKNREFLIRNFSQSFTGMEFPKKSNKYIEQTFYDNYFFTWHL